MSKQFDKYSAIIQSGVVTERDILNLKKLLNNWAVTSTTEDERQQLNNMLWDAYDKGGLRITPEQTEKGITWLRNQWMTPRGVERKHNPFGYREQEILANFDHFTFAYFYDQRRVYDDKDRHNYQPVYGVYAKDGSCFEYYMRRGDAYNGGDVEIIG